MTRVKCAGVKSRAAREIAIDDSVFLRVEKRSYRQTTPGGYERRFEPKTDMLSNDFHPDFF